MSIPSSLVLPLLGAVRRQLDGDLSLAVLATKVRRSPFELHRAFRELTGETTKRYITRLRLEEAAVRLVAARQSILDIALAAGFASHEVFTRAFVRELGITPREYRARGLTGDATRHAAVVREAGPCIGLYHLPLEPRTHTMSIEVTRRQLDPRPTLVIRRKIAATEIAKNLGEIFGRIWQYAQQHGIALAGAPFCRYLAMSRGTFTIEAGLPIDGRANGEGDIEISELPGGAAAVAVHVGPYDKLSETHAAVERWLDEHKLTAGAQWESYVTDPGQVPDQKDWRTEVIFPLGAKM